MTIRVEPLAGVELTAALDDLAGLRIAVFAEWPYLYAGDAAYERDYLAEFAEEPGSTLIVAYDGARIVGAATCSPMAGQKPEFRTPFEERGIDAARLCYFGESVLLPDYRGHGIGHAFFDQREATARALGADYATFCAVVRGEDHPALPADYRPLDGFWRNRGYGPVEGLVTSFDWQEHGHNAEVTHAMQFWMRPLNG